MRKFITLFAIIAISVASPIIQSGCVGTTTLQPGGVYTEPVLAKTDQEILDSDKILTDFVSWQSAHAAVLGAEIATLAQKVSANKNQWIKDAYAARDAYADDLKTYKAAIASGNTGAIPPTTAKINAAVAVIANITAQITAYKSAHSNV